MVSSWMCVLCTGVREIVRASQTTTTYNNKQTTVRHKTIKHTSHKRTDAKRGGSQLCLSLSPSPLSSSVLFLALIVVGSGLLSTTASTAAIAMREEDNNKRAKQKGKRKD